tara:strand:+ start:152 stop:403 length:252 start_codon:yes stop_codon:yes gene_type:complete
MTANEFVFWLKGIVDSTQFMPTKKTWDIIQETLKEVKFDKKQSQPLDGAVVKRLHDLSVPVPTPPLKNPYEIKCEKKEGVIDG